MFITILYHYYINHIFENVYYIVQSYHACQTYNIFQPCELCLKTGSNKKKGCTNIKL